jgi:hypothetical protein
MPCAVWRTDSHVRLVFSAPRSMTAFPTPLWRAIGPSYPLALAIVARAICFTEWDKRGGHAARRRRPGRYAAGTPPRSAASASAMSRAMAIRAGGTSSGDHHPFPPLVHVRAMLGGRPLAFRRWRPGLGARASSAAISGAWRHEQCLAPDAYVDIELNLAAKSECHGLSIARSRAKRDSGAPSGDAGPAPATVSGELLSDSSY